MLGDGVVASFGEVPFESRVVWGQWAPEGAGQLWESSGVCAFSGGFVRVVDPGRAAQMLEGVYGLPENSVVLFATGLGDLVVSAQGMFFVVFFRWGVVAPLPRGAGLAQVVGWLQDERVLDGVFGRGVFAEAVAADRGGVLGPDECYGFVPLLALGGPERAANLDRCGMWEHIALILAMAGPPAVGAELALPPA